MCVKSLQELLKVLLSVVRTGRSLRMVLHREDGGLAVLDPFDRAIIEVKVRHLQRLCPWNTARIAAHCESVVL